MKKCFFFTINATNLQWRDLYTEWSRREEKGCEISHFAFREKIFLSISLFPWKKGFFFEEFPFSHVKREEIFFNFPSYLKKYQKKMSFYLLKWAKSVIFCKKRRDSFLTFHWGKKNSISFPPWGKGIFFGRFPFPHVGREEIVFPFSFWTVTLSVQAHVKRQTNQRRHRNRTQSIDVTFAERKFSHCNRISLSSMKSVSENNFQEQIRNVESLISFRMTVEKKWTHSWICVNERVFDEAKAKISDILKIVNDCHKFKKTCRSRLCIRAINFFATRILKNRYNRN